MVVVMAYMKDYCILITNIVLETIEIKDILIVLEPLNTTITLTHEMNVITRT